MSNRSHHRYPRTARLNELMLEVLAEELERLNDPRLELVTFTGVEVNRDLSLAKVYYSTLGEAGATGDRDDAGSALEAAAPHLRRVLGNEVRVRQVPRLVFLRDPAIEAGQRIEAVLRELHRNESPPEEEGA